MNEFFADFGRRLAAAARRRGVESPPVELSSELSGELLDLTRVVAHGQERRFAPLASYLAGVMAGRMLAAGRSEDDIRAAVEEVRAEVEREYPDTQAPV